MKKILCCLLAAAMVFALCACGTSGGSGTYNPGTYTATAKGHNGDITVKATFDASSIKSVDLDVSGETEAIGQAAAATLKDQIIKAQSAKIDGVSGATDTSKAVMTAMADCIKQATKGGSATAEKKPVTDGTYSGTASSFGWTGQMKCDVTFAKNAISDIKVTQESDSATGEWFASAQSLLIPRLIKAQSLSVDAITGATSSSNAIKNCVADAIDKAGGDSTQWNTDVAKSTDTQKLEGYDVIVVGLGGSGVLSYCAAAEQGAKVFGVEAAGKIGGDSSCTYGPMAINSEYLKKLYNKGKDYFNPDDLYKVWLDYVGSDKKADVIHEAVYNSGTALDYYVNNFGFDFQGLPMLGSFVVPQWTKLWCVYTGDDNNKSWNVLGPNKTYQFTRALDKAKGMNEKNDYMTELTATGLITDANGAVTGVKATKYDGTTYEIYGKSVILATGGFLGNEDMMKQYLGSTVCTVGDTVNSGAGIQMGISAGGATYAMGTLPMTHISQVPNMIKNDDLTADQKAVLSALALTTDQKMITTEGKVWGNENKSGTEDKGITVEIVYAPNYKYYVVYSQDDIDNIKTKGLSKAQAAATSQFMGQGGKLPAAGTPVADIDTILSVGEQYKDVVKAASIADLAKAIGCDEKTLSESLGGKDTTYYAVTCAGYSYATVGGLDVNANMNVLKKDGTPIANLFAVGQDSEGVCNVDGKPYTPWAGQAQSWTFVSGQIAGTQAAKTAKSA